MRQRLCLLVSLWRVWVGRWELRRCARLAEARESAEVLRKAVLQHCLLVWRRKIATRRTRKEKTHETARRVLRRWHLRSRLHCLARRAASLQQHLAHRTLAEAFWRWRAAGAERQERRVQEKRLYSQQYRRRTQGALQRWRRALHTRRALSQQQEKKRHTLLSKCVKGWKEFVQRGAKVSVFLNLQQARRVKQSFQCWRDATQRCVQHKHLLLTLLFTRQHNVLHTASYDI
ncbi:uncharacterized protein LOC134456445 [Engraulis encrasicolus]|uniref:uncharacterized protein LOC134456445 n=1 Tax=Engraulis encrasicolus TaxID=184585 RepID=UPI002FD628D8